MPREIKFRGRRKDNKEWVYGFYIHDTNTGVDMHMIWNNDSMYSVDPETVGQYTGREDDNGAEIYESAEVIVTLKDWSTGKVLVKAQVKVEFRDCQFGFEWGFRKEFLTFSDFSNTTFEVVDHPHLLKEEEA